MHDGPGRPDARGPRIAIVGGGASGTLTAVQLLRGAAAQQLPVRVTLIDRHGRHGLGLAYSTTRPAHLMNVMAGQLSGLPDDPDHLVRWAGRAWRDAADAGPGVRAPANLQETFLPRQDYGRYLRDLLADAERQALPYARLSCLSDEVVAIRPAADGTAGQARLFLAGAAGEASGATGRPEYLDADVVVLATGNAPAQLPFEVPASDRVVTDPWAPGALDGVLSDAGPGAPVVIVGTGLTMLDLAVSLTAARQGTVVHAISRHGLLPRSHPSPPPATRQLWLPVLSRTCGTVRLTELMWQVRATIQSDPARWHAVVTGLRPYVRGLWRRLPDEDKRLFLRHVARYWEVHRHLVPPATASRIAMLRATGQLTVLRGQVRSVRTTAPGSFRILADTGPDTIELDAAWLINGTGATGNIRASATPLLRDLFATGQARPDALGLGLDATPAGALLDRAGQPSSTLFTLGPPLRGLWYETTAIPEIREQAAALAARITSTTRLRERPAGAA